MGFRRMRFVVLKEIMRGKMVNLTEGWKEL